MKKGSQSNLANPKVESVVVRHTDWAHKPGARRTKMAVLPDYDLPASLPRLFLSQSDLWLLRTAYAVQVVRIESEYLQFRQNGTS